jgi:hypothetical protein
MAATGLSCMPDTIEIIGNAGRHSSQPFMKGKGSTASNVECAVDSNRTTRHLDAIAVNDNPGTKPVVMKRPTVLHDPNYVELLSTQ